MFNGHLITNINDEEVLYLFINYDYEFSLDFRLKNKKEKIETLYDNVKDYVINKKINFKQGKIFLVVGGLVIGSLLFQNYKYSELKDETEPKYQYNEQIDIFDSSIPLKNIGGKTIAEESNKAEENIEITNITNTQESLTNNIKSNVQQATTKSTNSNISGSTTNLKAQTVVTPSVANTPTTTVTDTVAHETHQTPIATEKMVTLYRYNGIVETISLEDYVVGVVSAEMPASFNIEALKAQSVLARTYALKKISKNQVLKDTSSDQVYKDISQLKSMWGNDFQIYYNKIVSAVASTKGRYLTYNDDYIEAVYHSTSNGQTEDAIAVWGNSYPYLKSVDSHWDLTANSYLREISKEFNVLSSIIGIDFNAITDIEILSRTPGNRIEKIKINNKTLSGIELRNLLGLRSADFDIKIEGDTAIFVTKGYGHGVGMSQYGANGMAKEGYNYTDILAHYYPGTKLKS